MKTIEQCTRAELEDEAKHLGIEGYQHLTRRELVRVLRGRLRAGRLQTARQALWHAAQALERGSGLLGRFLRRAEATAPQTKEPDQPNQPAGITAGDSAAHGVLEQAAVSDSSAEPSRPTQAVPNTALGPAPAAEDESTAEQGNTAGEQGESTAKQRESAGERPAAARDEVRCERQGDELHIRWDVSPSGLTRAEAVLGATGELTLRLIAVAPDPSEVLRTDVTDQRPIERSGRWSTPALDPGSRGLAAVGLLAQGRFVAISHAKTP
ncbi:MAG: hypothetical protein MJD61_14140 [Proteobacteria bacterium]|nr:hypothetical protein [Pseudomonadota bacterium]